MKTCLPGREGGRVCPRLCPPRHSLSKPLTSEMNIPGAHTAFPACSLGAHPTYSPDSPALPSQAPTLTALATGTAISCPLLLPGL